MAKARRLHTAYGDEIREIARTDPERAAEMRMESIEYANEVRGFYDEDYDPYDDYDGPAGVSDEEFEEEDEEIEE